MSGVEYRDLDTDEFILRSNTTYVPREGERIWLYLPEKSSVQLLYNVDQVCWWVNRYYTNPLVYVKKVTDE